MSSKYYFAGAVSKAFAKARPSVSEEAKNKIMEFLNQKLGPPHEFALDVGCGTGHSTALFVPYFNRVLGIDTSETQIEQAISNYPLPNVTYKVGDANCLPCDDQSVSLVVCAQTAHWLDLPKFFDECKRVLKPNGVLALLGYDLLRIHYGQDPKADNQLNQTVKDFYKTISEGGYWDEKRYILDHQYFEIELPYGDRLVLRSDPSIHLRKEMSVETLVEYFSSWSGYLELLRQNPTSTLLGDLEQKLISAVLGGNKETILEVIYPWFILACRKPSSLSS